MHPHPLSTYGIFLKRLDEFEKDCIEEGLTFTPDNMLFFLSYNPLLTAEIVKKHNGWNWWMLMKHPNILLHDIYDVIPASEKSKIYMYPYAINLNIETLLRHRYELWDWSKLTKHPNIKIEDIIDHPTLPWNLEEISNNPNIQLHHLKKYPTLPWKDDIVFKEFSKTASFKEIIELPNKPWCFEHYLVNEKHTKEELEELVLFTLLHTKRNYYNGYEYHYMDIFTRTSSPINWVYGYLCQNTRLNFADLYDIYLHLNERLKKLIHKVTWLSKIDGLFPCCYIFKEQLLHNKLLPGKTFISKDEVFSKLSYNKNITSADIKKYPNEDWNYIPLSEIIDDIPYVFENYRKNWDLYSVFVRNKHMTKELAIQYENKMGPSGIYFYIANPVCTCEEIKEFVTKYRHKKVSIFLYSEHKEGCKRFSENFFKKPDFLQPSFQEMKEYFAKKKIIRILVEVVTCPAYLWCRNRLTKEYTVLKNDGVLNL